MKNKLFLLAVVLCFSCTQLNKPLTSAEKDKIVSEAKAVITTVYLVCETSDTVKLRSMWLDSPDFVALMGGSVTDYTQSVKGMQAYFSAVVSQKATVRFEKYTVLDPNTVMYTASTRWEAKLKNDSTMVMDPIGVQYILKKTDDQWKLVSWVEGGKI